METSGRKVIELNIEDVLPNRFQPRIKFNEEAINELSKSIKEHGVIQPIVVRPIGDKFEIIAGERRYKASCMANLKTIPAIITDLNDKDSAEVALIENVQRENLTPIEEAISYKKILDMGYITQDALAAKLGKTQSTVANKLRLLNLDDEVQEALLNERISERHARSLLKLTDKQQQRQMLNKIIQERLTVRRADEEIDKMLNGEITEEPIKEEKEEKFKFINMPIETKDEYEEEQEIEEAEENNEEITPRKFSNLLEEENEEPEQEETTDFNKIFINPALSIEQSNNSLIEELNEIENSINNSNTIKPITEEDTIEPITEEIDNIDDEFEFIEEDEIDDEENIKNDEELEENDEEEIEEPKFKEKETKKITTMKDAIESVRNVSENIEKSGFVIETEEYDLDDMYQIVFKINKKD